MDAKLDFSVIVPVYNMAQCLEACVISICKQDYPSFEVILVDDGSTDESLAVCSCLAARDARIAVYHQENAGPGSARNLGIQHAKGRYALFLDADDFLHPGALEKLNQATENGIYDLVVFGFRSKLFGEGKSLSEKTYPAITREGEAVRQDYGDYIGDGAPLRIQGAPWNKLFSLEIIQKNSVEYPNQRRHEDEVFISRYMCFSAHIRFLSEILYTHYVSDLRLEWTKYRPNYIDDILATYADRQRNVLSWNPSDVRTRERVEKEYIDTVLRAMEMTFSPRLSIRSKERLALMKEISELANLENFPVPNCLTRYKHLQMQLLQKGNYRQIYATMWLRIQMEKSGWFHRIKAVANTRRNAK